MSGDYQPKPEEQKKEGIKDNAVHTPPTVKREWYNLADLKDKVALNYNLADDYDSNMLGVHPIDKIVYNNYNYKGKRNPHAAYGYLRCPEIADILNAFLTRDRNRLWFYFNKKYNEIMDLIISKFNY